MELIMLRVPAFTRISVSPHTFSIASPALAFTCAALAPSCCRLPASQQTAVEAAVAAAAQSAQPYRHRSDANYFFLSRITSRPAAVRADSWRCAPGERRRRAARPMRPSAASASRESYTSGSGPVSRPPTASEVGRVRLPLEPGLRPVVYNLLSSNKVRARSSAHAPHAPALAHVMHKLTATLLVWLLPQAAAVAAAAIAAIAAAVLA